MKVYMEVWRYALALQRYGSANHRRTCIIYVPLNMNMPLGVLITCPVCSMAYAQSLYRTAAKSLTAA